MVLVFLLASQSAGFRTLEFRLQDLVLYHQEHPTPSPGIVIIDIDDETVEIMSEKYGRWPWPRFVYSPIIEYCMRAPVIGFDVIFAEKEPQYGWPDEDFLDAVKEQGQVVSAALLLDEERTLPSSRPPASFSLGVHPPAESRLPPHESILGPYPALMERSAMLGTVNVAVDSDGITRRYPLVTQRGEDLYPSLALAVLLHADPEFWKPMKFDAKGRMAIGKTPWKLDAEGAFRLAPVSHDFHAYPFWEVWQSWEAELKGEPPSIPRSAFENKIILVGTTASGGIQRDRIVTPVHASYPGVMLHGAAIDGLMRHRRVSTGGGLLLLCCTTLLAFFPECIKATSARRNFITCLGVMLAYTLLFAVLAKAWLFLIPLTVPLGAGLLQASWAGVRHWQEAQQKNRALEELERTRQDLTDMLVHDIKGRLATVDLGLGMLERDMVRHPENLHPRLQQIQSSSSRLGSLVSALLDVRRIEENRMPVKIQPVDVIRETRKIIRILEPSAEMMQLTIQLIIPPQDTPWLQADPYLLTRILENLGWNALQHARRGSVIGFEVACGEQGLQIVIRNEGKSIAPEALEKVFDPFVTLDQKPNAPRAQGAGFGIGLAFCKLATQAHGGTIAIDSPLDNQLEGVMVTLTFPNYALTPPD